VLTYSLGPIKGNIRAFWKEHEHEYPVLARLARDILSTPASGAGVERLFNCARDVCHYRRGQLKPSTIRSLMLHQFASKFELEQSELEMIKEYLSSGEADMLQTIWKPISPVIVDAEPISDDEEEGYGGELDDSEDDDIEEGITTMAQDTQARRKRRRRPSSEPRDDTPQYPEVTVEENTQPRSGRIRKRPKLPAGFEIDKL
jgi:hAT family C-terminal dimerisation region